MTASKITDEAVDRCWHEAYRLALPRRGDPVWARATADAAALRRYGRTPADPHRREMERQVVIDMGARLASMGPVTAVAR